MSEVTVKQYTATWPLLAASAVLAAAAFTGLPAWLILVPLALVALECVLCMPAYVQAMFIGTRGLRIQLERLHQLHEAGKIVLDDPDGDS